MADKNFLRKHFKFIRKYYRTHYPQSICKLNHSITHNILHKFHFSPRSSYAFYWPMGSEYDVRPVVEQLHKDGITILLPYVSHMNQTLVFYPYTPGHSIKDILGFSIPVSRETSFQPDYIFAPLLAADMIGNRLGYGGGYYDRTLSGICKKIVYIGVGYSFQRVSSLNPSKNDVPLMGYVDEFGLDTFGNKFNDI